MRYKNLKLSAILLLALGTAGLQAQETVPATGGDASGSGGSSSYTVGQLFYTTITGTNGSVTQGLQQPYEISVITGIEEAKGIDLNVSAFPNPTTDVLNLEIGNYDNTNLSYQLFDMQGRMVVSKKITGDHTSIGTGNLVSATYFLRVLEDNKEIKSFKIIKN